MTSRSVVAGAVLASYLTVGCGGKEGSDIAARQEAGRYQVINGAASIMLLDTKTGRSWLACMATDSTSDARVNWCAMKHLGTATAPPSEKP
jgi:hypothetical protein